MADRPEMFAPTRGFSRMADSMEPCKMVWVNPCCHGNDIWARRGDLVANRLVIFLYVVRVVYCYVADQVYRFPMTFRLAENYPVDLYFLMDVSRTMRSYKENLVALSDRLGRFSQIFLVFSQHVVNTVRQAPCPIYRCLISEILCYGATENAGQENAGLEIDGQKLQEVENDGHSIKG